VIFSKGQMTDLGSLTGSASEAFVINDRGEVVGDWTLGDGGQHAFLYSKSKGMKDLETLGSTFSIAYAVNNFGRFVGVTNTGTGITVAFIYEDGIMKDLNAFIPSSSGWSLIKATGINDVGQIVGIGVFNGPLRGFLLTGVQ
jgi:probable HAF family extracellular repeat protein